MMLNKQDKKEKEIRTILVELDKLYKLKREAPYNKLITPIRNGYYVTLKPLDKFKFTSLYSIIEEAISKCVNNYLWIKSKKQAYLTYKLADTIHLKNYGNIILYSKDVLKYFYLDEEINYFGKAYKKVVPNTRFFRSVEFKFVRCYTVATKQIYPDIEVKIDELQSRLLEINNNRWTLGSKKKKNEWFTPKFIQEERNSKKHKNLTID